MHNGSIYKGKQIMQVSNISESVIDFEKKYGTDLFLKATISVINKILIKKNIVTEQEIQEELIKILKELKQERKNESSN